jgi:hypothetical protein
MFRFLKPLMSARVPRPVWLELECLEHRQLLSVGVTHFGTLGYNVSPEIMVLGLDHQIYAQEFDPNGGSVKNYFLVAPGQVKAFAVGEFTSTLHREVTPALFAIGLDDQLYGVSFNYYDGLPNSGYFLTGLGRVSAVALGNAHTAPRVFVIGLDDQVYSQSPGTGAYTLTEPGQVQVMAFGVTGTGLEMFVLGLDNQVYAQMFDGSGQSTGPYFLTRPGQVQSFLVGQLPGAPELFAIGLDNQLYAQTFDQNGHSTSNYQLTTAGGITDLTVANPGIGMGGPGAEVLAIGFDGQVYSQTFDAGGASTSSYVLTQPGGIRSVDASGGLLFVVGLDGQVYEQKFDPTGASLGPYTLTRPGQVL